MKELPDEFPAHLEKFWGQDCWTWHTVEWWKSLWERTGLVDIEVADTLENVRGVFITRDKFVGKSGQIPELISIEAGFEDKFIKSKLDDILPDEFRIF